MRILSSAEELGVAGGLVQPLDEVIAWGHRFTWPSQFEMYQELLRRGWGMGTGVDYRLIALKDLGFTEDPDDNDGDGQQDAVKDEVEKKAAETAAKLEKLVVEAQKCGIPVSTLFNFTSGESGAVWRECFKNLPQKEKDNLRDALTVIATGFALEKSTNPIKIAVNALMHDERLMLAELAKSLSANDGWWFGENLATLSKGGWDSQIILELIQSVFRVTARP